MTPLNEQQYTTRLKRCLNALEKLLINPQFGIGPNTIGAEMEVSIVDQNWNCANINQQLLSDLQDELMQCELDQFNLEFNAPPVYPKGTPFTKIEQRLTDALGRMNKAAKAYQSKIIPIGILPTLTLEHLTAEAITRLERYQLLSTCLKTMRGGPFLVNIDGKEPLKVSCDDVTLEGANTSYQVHLRVNPTDFAETFNTISLITPLVVAISANSPYFLGHELWDETRIALFQQSVDYRNLSKPLHWHLPNRVSFGYGWLRKSAFECFAENVAIFPPLLPYGTEEDIEKKMAQGKTPELAELRLHQGVVWHWNRAIYDPAEEGHLRIEMRSLPSGPTPADMTANSAFMIGLAFGLRHHIEKHIQTLPFKYAEENFYRAAKFGLDAQLVWFSAKNYQLSLMPVSTLLHWALPYAKQGLQELGVDDAEIDKFLQIIEVRLQRRMTGAIWQKQRVNALEANGFKRSQALQEMTKSYTEQANSGQPVGEWEGKCR